MCFLQNRTIVYSSLPHWTNSTSIPHSLISTVTLHWDTEREERSYLNVPVINSHLFKDHQQSSRFMSTCSVLMHYRHSGYSQGVIIICLVAGQMHKSRNYFTSFAISSVPLKTWENDVFAALEPQRLCLSSFISHYYLLGSQPFRRSLLLWGCSLIASET